MRHLFTRESVIIILNNTEFINARRKEIIDAIDMFATQETFINGGTFA